jgi:hypothetical protein
MGKAALLEEQTGGQTDVGCGRKRIGLVIPWLLSAAAVLLHASEGLVLLFDPDVHTGNGA